MGSVPFIRPKKMIPLHAIFLGALRKLDYIVFLARNTHTISCLQASTVADSWGISSNSWSWHFVGASTSNLLADFRKGWRRKRGVSD